MQYIETPTAGSPSCISPFTNTWRTVLRQSRHTHTLHMESPPHTVPFLKADESTEATHHSAHLIKAPCVQYLLRPQLLTGRLQNLLLPRQGVIQTFPMFLKPKDFILTRCCKSTRSSWPLQPTHYGSKDPNSQREQRERKLKICGKNVESKSTH